MAAIVFAASAVGLSACSSVTSGTAQPLHNGTSNVYSGHTQSAPADTFVDLDNTTGDPLDPTNFSSPDCTAGHSAKQCLESLVGTKAKVTGEVVGTYPAPGDNRVVEMTRAGVTGPWLELCSSSVVGCDSVNVGDKVSTVFRIDHVQFPGVDPRLTALPGMVAESVTVVQ